MSNQTAEPLDDLRVIELGVLLAGPYCGQLLGDFGAEVIKVEQPDAGDPMRDWGHVRPDGQSLWWPVVARNKKSITLNLREPEGQEILKELVAESDIVLENFRPGTMERWGLGYDVLSKINPGLIMTRVSGYGQTGPDSKKAGYAAIGEAMGGLRYVMGNPGLPPSRAGVSLGDSLAAMFAFNGTLAALHYRERTGKGQQVDSAIYESVLALMESTIPEYQFSGHIRERTGSFLPNVSPSNIFDCSDGMILIAANQDTVFRRLADAMGRPDLKEDPKYATHLARGDNQVELDALINEWSKQFEADEVQRLCDEGGVPCGKIYRAPDMLSDPQYAARDAIIEVEHPVLGAFKMQNAFPKLSETPGSVKSVGPALGEHNTHVYEEILRKTSAELANLKNKGII